jgi:hypothetical protein
LPAVRLPRRRSSAGRLARSSCNQSRHAHVRHKCRGVRFEASSILLQWVFV